MKFGAIPVAEAQGAILAHGIYSPGIAYKKGRVLTAADVAHLRGAGHDTVMAARLGSEDVPEDEAAAAIAAAVAGEGLSVAEASTGRCNLFATVHGLAVIDRPRLDQVNLVDETITVATVEPFALVEPGQMVATVKIIPLAAPVEAVRACEALARGHPPPVRIAALRSHRVGLVQTRLPGTKDSVLEKTVATTRARLEALGNTLAAVTVVNHTEAAVAAAIAAQRAAGAGPILAVGASAIVDRRDVIPAAVVAAGGEVVHFGMPVDPGNLLMLGRIGGTAVLGLPGCARSPKLNGFDWVLQRILCGLTVSRADIMTMGAGGLLTQAAAGSQPSMRADDMPAASASETQPGICAAPPRIAAVVLAAGRSSRMADINKLLAEIDGQPMIARVVDAVLSSRAGPVVVVVGHDADRVRAAIDERPVRIVHNPDFQAGLSTSLRAGIDHLPLGIDGAVFVLGDMPKVGRSHIDGLIDRFDPDRDRAICVPTWGGKRGNPVLWSTRYFLELRQLSGDVGGRTLLLAHADVVAEVPMPDDGVLLDVDTAEAFGAL